MISLLSVLSTPENTYGCCDGYEWNDVKKDCVGMSIALVILNKKTRIVFSTFSNINKYSNNYITFFYFIECNSGYTGIGCTLTCLYPLYGKDCQQICDCSRMECDFEFGCRSGRYILYK